jgi:hypothetical protein
MKINETKEIDGESFGDDRRSDRDINDSIIKIKRPCVVGEFMMKERAHPY